jgi:predicted dehydrogenase
LITLDPGHFHAALVQKSGYPGIDTVVHVYAPGGQELQSHLALIEKYNTRSDSPTHWKEQVYEGGDFLIRMFRERAGNVVVLAGNNKRKIGYIGAAVDSGFNVFSDKPMVIEPADFPKLEKAFETAKERHVLLYDIMTERYQITTILQRKLSQAASIFGTLEKGTAENPAVTKESVHHFFKYVSGKPLTRPAWYFDVSQEGEGIVDVTTHLVDLIQWECFPDSILHYKTDIDMLSAKRWATTLSPAEFKQVTGLDRDSALSVYANGEMNYTLKGVHARVSVKWNFQAPEGAGDTHYSVLRGSLANLVIRQGKDQGYKPVLSIEPMHNTAEYEKAVNAVIAEWQGEYAGLAVKKTPKGWDLLVPDKYAKDHEATFAEVTKKFLRCVQEGKLPEWEVPNMLAKYYTTMQALEKARLKIKG